jgi:hypothetical protein
MARRRTESCKDCSNLEDRRDVDRVALCALHHGPSVSCQEFKPRNGSVDINVSHDRFCVNCANYEEIDGVPFCARDHRPGIACGGFNRREEIAAEAV